MRRARLAVLALTATLALSACGDASGTFIIVKFKRGNIPGQVTRIDVSLSLAGQPTAHMAMLAEKSGGAIALDDAGSIDGSFRIHKGMGLATISATAFDGTNPVGMGSAMIEVLRDQTRTVELCFGGCPMADAGVDGSMTGGLLISPSEYDFGTLLTGTSSAPVLLTVTNTGSVASGRPTLMLSAQTPFSATGCDTPALAAGGVCQILVLFQPTATGDATVMLSVSGSPGGTTTTTLRGKGAAPGALMLTPATRNFGSVAVGGASAPVTFEVVNTGLAATSPLITAVTGTDMSHFAIVSDSCLGQSLSPGGRCTLSVALRPTSAGTKAAALVVSGSPGGTAVSTLSGTGLTAGSLVISPATRDFGTAAQGSPGAVEGFTVRNAGSTPVTGLQATLTGSGAGEYMITQDGCSSMMLGAGLSCLVKVQFLPLGGGIKVATLSVAGGGGAASAALIGTGIAPAQLDIMPRMHDFGMVSVGSSASLTLQIVNTGGAATGAITHSLVGTDFTFVGGSCTTLMPGASCQMTVRLTPAGSAGARMASMTVMASPGGNATSMLMGTAVAAGGLSITPSPHDYGDTPQGGERSQVFTVTNGTGAMTGALGTGISGSGASSFAVVAAGDGCTGQVLPASGTCQFTVKFVPAASGPLSASLAVSGSPGGVTTSALSGFGQAPPALSISPPSRDFGVVPVGGNGPTQVFTVTNTGAQTANGLSAVVAGSNASEFVIGSNGCTSNLAPTAQCTVSVQFRPTSAGNGKVANLNVSATNGAQTSASLSGAATTQASLSIAPTSQDFGPIDLGMTSGTRSFSVSNVGGTTSGTISVNLIGGNTGDFTKVGDSCSGNTLSSGGSCTLTFTFTPSAAGTRSSSVVVSATPGGSTSAGISGTGVNPASPAMLVLSPGGHDFGTIGLGSSSAFTYSVQNKGGRDSSAISFSLSGTGASQFKLETAGFSGECQNGITMLAPNDSCTIQVRFQPLSIGMHSATLQASATMGGTTTAGMMGNAVAGGTTLFGSPPMIDFGCVEPGQSSQVVQWTVTNNGAVPSGLPSTQFQGTPTVFFIFSSTCTAPIPAGNQCTISLQYRPSTRGMHTGSLQLMATPGGTVSVGLLGNTPSSGAAADGGITTGCSATGGGDVPP